MLLAGCGGFIGAAGRYLAGRWAAAVWGSSWPVGTFLVNITGCLLFGLLTGLLLRTNSMSEQANIVLVTGFCGGFTTFSTFAGDIYTLFSTGHWLSAILYLSVSILFGILMVMAGRYLALRVI